MVIHPRPKDQASLLRIAQRRRRQDGYLYAAALGPVLVQQALRAMRGRNGYGVAAAAVPLVAVLTRAELSARQLPAQWSARDRFIQRHRDVVDAARARGDNPQDAANEHSRRHGLSLLPAGASVLMLLGGQLLRRRRGPGRHEAESQRTTGGMG